MLQYPSRKEEQVLNSEPYTTPHINRGVLQYPSTKEKSSKPGTMLQYKKRGRGASSTQDKRKRSKTRGRGAISSQLAPECVIRWLQLVGSLK